MGNTLSSSFEGIEDEIRIVMIGKTGCGKSATGNSILRKEVFTSGNNFSSCTRYCKRGESTFDTGIKLYKIIVVDTPGLFDTKSKTDDVNKEIAKCLGVSSPGPHVILFVVSLAARFTQEEENTALHFSNQFGEKLVDFVVIIFSHGDTIKKDDSIEQIIAGAPKSLQELIKKCGSRYMVFNNDLKSTDKMKKQLKTLMEIVEKTIESNGKSFYTDEMYKKAEEELQKRIEELAIENDKMKPVDLRKTVRDEVEENGDVLSLIRQGIYAFGKVMVTSAVDATGIPGLIKGLTKCVIQEETTDQTSKQ